MGVRMNTKIAYHFVGETLRDGRPIPADGEWLEHDGEIEICMSGLHASSHPFDALEYAPGNTLCLVEVDGDISEQEDKLVCRRRRIIARIDAEPLLREFARWCALQVIDLWDAPDVVRQYLTTGNESLRAEAWDALAAARAAVWDSRAALAEAWDALGAALAAAWDARAAEWDIRGAALAAARSAEWAAKWNATETAVKAAQRDKFNEMVTAAFAKHI